MKILLVDDAKSVQLVMTTRLPKKAVATGSC